MSTRSTHKALALSIIIAAIFLSSTPSHAYNNEKAQGTKLANTSQQLNNLDIDQVLKVEAIRKNYQALLSAYREKLAAEQKIFNQGLKVDSNEESIRQAFVPVSQAMEDVAVCQIKMIQEINMALALNSPPQIPGENNGQQVKPEAELGANTLSNN